MDFKTITIKIGFPFIIFPWLIILNCNSRVQQQWSRIQTNNSTSLLLQEALMLHHMFWCTTVWEVRLVCPPHLLWHRWWLLSVMRVTHQPHTSPSHSPTVGTTVLEVSTGHSQPSFVLLEDFYHLCSKFCGLHSCRHLCRLFISSIFYFILLKTIFIL